VVEVVHLAEGRSGRRISSSNNRSSSNQPAACLEIRRHNPLLVLMHSVRHIIPIKISNNSLDSSQATQATSLFSVALNPQRLSLPQLALVALGPLNNNKISQLNNSNRPYSAVALVPDSLAAAISNSSNKILSSLRTIHVRR
jgi:hypothetical protein